MSSEREPLNNSGTSYGAVEPAPAVCTRGLQRGLSARQVQMIAIAGTIGTGLFLGSGKSLAEGGPASMLICYTLVGAIVYVTLLLLGEMATQYPVAGSFNAYAARFFSPSYAFALSWNYWFNDAVSVASDLIAAQLVLRFWTSSSYTWIVSAAFWLFLVGVNAIHVKAYGELEYWLSFLKVATVVMFIILGLLVNVGVNAEREVIGFSNWKIPGAPFVGGFGGFAKVFVTASFAFGGTESLGITAGETANPTKNMPRVVKFVFWRIILFYLLSVLLIGLNVPWDYPNLSDKSTATSPFTIVFKEAGSKFAASFMNTVILTSVLSAGNHALFAGTRVLYGLAVTEPPQAPTIFSWTTSRGVPLPALLLTSSVSALCFGSSRVGNGVLWAWLQNLVGVSNQVRGSKVPLVSWFPTLSRDRLAFNRSGELAIQESVAQPRALAVGSGIPREMDLALRPSLRGQTQPHPLEPFISQTLISDRHGPDFDHWSGLSFRIPAALCLLTVMDLVQGWSSVIPQFSLVDFVSFYVEIPLMVAMYLVWAFASRRSLADLVDVDCVDLDKDQYVDDKSDDEVPESRGFWQSMYYWLA
ncbi:unnamed protein product [Mycena citricolor]|uniref:Amino acid permease/ SLC12A domain-containing protein n=1 Tax=Mycena citricolor TaxID=2018698 RepID=A0AAD2K687_9AGAR|nr:unnamed protein product [Mycena citricolor]